MNSTYHVWWNGIWPFAQPEPMYSSFQTLHYLRNENDRFRYWRAVASTQFENVVTYFDMPTNIMDQELDREALDQVQKDVVRAGHYCFDVAMLYPKTYQVTRRSTMYCKLHYTYLVFNFAQTGVEDEGFGFA